MKFSKGDIIVGNQQNRYPITGQLAICEVVKCYDGGDITVRIVGYRNINVKEELEQLTDVSFTVESQYFDIFEECVI